MDIDKLNDIFNSLTEEEKCEMWQLYLKWKGNKNHKMYLDMCDMWSDPVEKQAFFDKTDENYRKAKEKRESKQNKT